LVIAGGLELEGMDQGLGNGTLLGDWLKEFCDCKLVAEIQNDYDESRVMNTNRFKICLMAASCTDKLIGKLILSPSRQVISLTSCERRDQPTLLGSR